MLAMPPMPRGDVGGGDVEWDMAGCGCGPVPLVGFGSEDAVVTDGKCRNGLFTSVV
jgi:hypothetical protein